MAEQKADNLTWHGGEVGKVDRELQLGQRGVILWFTGLSGSGKSVTAVALEQKLHELGRASYRLDGDNIRHGLNKDLGFSPEDREENIRRIGEVATLMADAGLIVLSSFISPYQKDRDAIRAMVPQGDFIEVFVDCPVEVCEARDPKGLYKKARAGEISEFTGVSAPYEAPEMAEIRLHADTETIDESVAIILSYLQEVGIVSAA